MSLLSSARRRRRSNNSYTCQYKYSLRITTHNAPIKSEVFVKKVEVEIFVNEIILLVLCSVVIDKTPLCRRNRLQEAGDFPYLRIPISVLPCPPYGGLYGYRSSSPLPRNPHGV